MVSETRLNPIQDGPFQGCSRMGAKKLLLLKTFHIYPAMINICADNPLPKEDSRNL